MKIVSDTGPLLHLLEAESLPLLGHAGLVLVPPAVQSEMLAHEEQWQTVQPSWVEVVPLEGHFGELAHSWKISKVLDEGEAEAIALCSQSSPDWFLTDDTAARLVAEGQGLEVHGSLGVILWAAVSGIVDFGEAKEALERLAKSSLWVSARVLTEAKAALSEIFSRQ